MQSSDALVLITSTGSQLLSRRCAEVSGSSEPLEIDPLKRVSLEDLDALPQQLNEWQSAQSSQPRAFNELALVLISDDEFPRWPKFDRLQLSTLVNSPVLIVKARPNLRAAWTAFANGAIAASADGSTICSITMQAETTDVAICRNGEVIDTASMSIGPQCLLFNSDLQVTQISDTGEMFLDAVAKKIKAADLVEESMVNLIGALIGEAIANLICRKKAPQVTQRLLASDPLKHDYQIDRIFMSGQILEYARQLNIDPREHGHLGGYLAHNVLASFSERERVVELVDAMELNNTMWGGAPEQLELQDLSTKKLGKIEYELANAAVLAVPESLPGMDGKSFLANRIEERIRRFHIEPGAPILVSLNVDGAESDIISDTNLRAIDRVITARQAVDASMFLKKPKDFVILATSHNQDPQSVSAIRRLAAEAANKSIQARIVLVDSPWNSAGENYITWRVPRHDDELQGDYKLSALMHQLRLLSPATARVG